MTMAILKKCGQKLCKTRQKSNNTKFSTKDKNNGRGCSTYYIGGNGGWWFKCNFLVNQTTSENLNFYKDNEILRKYIKWTKVRAQNSNFHESWLKIQPCSL